MEFDTNLENSQLYISMMRPIFLQKALFSDTTKNYVFPEEPEPFSDIEIRFRTYINNVDYVCLVTDESEYMMEKTKRDGFFDFYSVKVPLTDSDLNYYFRIKAGKIVCYYDVRGVVKNNHDPLKFHIVPGFHTPEWAKGAVIYQIYVDRFSNGDAFNDVVNGEYYYVGGPVVKVDDWYKNPAVDGTKEFYGGDLQGVINKLGYLHNLGVEAIYFNPLFVSPSNHKYDIQDYEHIDPHFGRIVKDEGDVLWPGDKDNRHATKYQCRVCSKENLEASDALFAELVAKAHELGIKIILDGVFNHCGSFNKWLDREGIYDGHEGFADGAYKSADSPYRNYFDFKNQYEWPNNGSYDGWWGYDTLPKLNYEGSEELYNKILEIGKKWVSWPYNVDGWRLDVAADLGHSSEFNHKFFKDFRKAVKEANPDAVILAEHYGDPKAWLNGKEWDSVMNYDAFMEPVTWFLTGMQKHSDEFHGELLGNDRAFWDMMRYQGNRLSNCSSMIAMNQLSNHDHSRFLTRTNQRVGRINSAGFEAASVGINKAVMRHAVMIQMTWTGAPTIYYGDEAGLTGFTDPDNRRTYPWGSEDRELIDFHREMIRIHKENTEIKNGSLLPIISESYLIGYARFTDEDTTIVIINRDDNERKVKAQVFAVALKDSKMFERIMQSTKEGFDTSISDVSCEGGKLILTVPGQSGTVLRTKR